MPQPKKPDLSIPIQEILKLVDALPPEEQIQLMEELELKQVDEQQLEWLRAEIKKGDDAIREGRFSTGEEVIARLWAKHKARETSYSRKT